ncbi:MAG: hypothetical protein GXP24_08605 [Planctomycetes bacterium]|nr:hypothetical protein [Planctomycetota bacterium]
MTEHGSFYRKIIYLVLIAVLLFPISQLGAPATTEDEGGRLAQLRDEYDLGQSDYGDIDPASETIRLATLGLRGVAVSMLWTKANEYKKKEDWTNFQATLEQLAKLQPYFIKFWQYQAWNLTYNVSVELDDVRDRFHYVKRGIGFLKKGITYNRDSPYLLSDLGWFIGNKIGRADERKDYRRLFKADPDFHPADRPLEQRDNWLVSRGWYETSVSAVDDKKKSLGQKNPTTFYANPGRSQINYSEAIETEGVFGEKAKSAWATAARMWKDFGNRDLKSSMGFNIRLSGVERLTEESKELEKRLGELSRTGREDALAAKRAALTAEQRAVLDGPETGLTDEQRDMRYEAQQLMRIEPADIADQIVKKSPEKVAEARRLAKKISAIRNRIRLTKNNSDVVNYEYWATRCRLEQTPEALKARDLSYAGRKVFKEDADLLEAKRLYEDSFVQWAKVLEAFPELPLDSVTGSDIMEYIEQYSTVLQQLDMSLVDEEVGRDFPLWRLVEANDNSREYEEGIRKYLGREEPPRDAAPSGVAPDETPDKTPTDEPPSNGDVEEEADEPVAGETGEEVTEDSE